MTRRRTLIVEKSQAIHCLFPTSHCPEVKIIFKRSSVIPDYFVAFWCRSYPMVCVYRSKLLQGELHGT